jgi:hypothetical protein
MEPVIRHILTLTLLLAPVAAGTQPADIAPSAPAAAASPGEAEHRLRAAIQLDPDQGSYHLELAELLRAQGRQAEADQALRRAIELGALGSVPEEAAGGNDRPLPVDGRPAAPAAQRTGGRPVVGPAVVAVLTMMAGVVLGVAGVAILIPLVAGILAVLVVVPVQALRTALHRRRHRNPVSPPPLLSGPATESPRRRKVGSEARRVGAGRRRRGRR